LIKRPAAKVPKHTQIDYYRWAHLGIESKKKKEAYLFKLTKYEQNYSRKKKHSSNNLVNHK